jgi:hypothetical protein
VLLYYSIGTSCLCVSLFIQSNLQTLGLRYDRSFNTEVQTVWLSLVSEKNAATKIGDVYFLECLPFHT